LAYNDFEKMAKNSFKFNLFLLTKLPSAYICGVRLRSISESEAVVSVPYKWLSQNPFKSIYFACQAMAGELSTGILCMAHTFKHNPPISMLVVSLHATYTKKATERIYFTCSNGLQIKAAIQKSIETGEGQTVKAVSTGKNKAGEVVSEFTIEWSFKAKKNK
jgi:hypothetical protein